MNERQSESTNRKGGIENDECRTHEQGNDRGRAGRRGGRRPARQGPASRPVLQAAQGRHRRHSQRKENDYLPHQEVQSQRAGAPAVSGADEPFDGRDA